MKRLAVIPARGGSRRLARKNVADFGGRPMLVWTVQAAMVCDCFDRVVVSTEDPAIARIGRLAGAELHERSPELASDSARVVDVCLDLLAGEEAAGRSYEILCCLYPTAPLRSADDIVGVMELLQIGVCEFAMATTRYTHPPHQALRRVEDGLLQPLWPDLVDRRASDFGALEVDNGSTYACSVSALRRHRTFYGPGLRGWRMPFERSIDIDELDDLMLAKRLASGGAAQ